MPILDFVCMKCAARFELNVSIYAENPKVHEGGCGGELRRDFAAGLPGTVYKGAGWAKRDRKIRSQI
jgi:predicted nucleic acid-binding Zn ribbon protein